MKYNTLLFEEKLQKLKKKAKELQIKNMETNKYKKNKPLNHNSAKKDVHPSKWVKETVFPLFASDYSF